jgi:hypothetical protein
MAVKPAPGLFITARETDIFRVVAHTWLICHTLSNRKELREKRKRGRPLLYSLRTLCNALVAVASAYTAANSLWQLMSS